MKIHLILSLFLLRIFQYQIYGIAQYFSFFFFFVNIIQLHLSVRGCCCCYCWYKLSSTLVSYHVPKNIHKRIKRWKEKKAKENTMCIYFFGLKLYDKIWREGVFVPSHDRARWRMKKNLKYHIFWSYILHCYRDL